jgi:hypothetical protein
MATFPRLAAPAQAARCPDHEGCIRIYRPDGAINELGWWHAQWRGDAWHVLGPDPADAGFPTLGGPTDKELKVGDADPVQALAPYVGTDAAAMAQILFPPAAPR